MATVDQHGRSNSQARAVSKSDDGMYMPNNLYAVSVDCDLAITVVKQAAAQAEEVSGYARPSAIMVPT
jgi:hypothetical protein